MSLHRNHENTCSNPSEQYQQEDYCQKKPDENLALSSNDQTEYNQDELYGKGKDSLN